MSLFQVKQKVMYGYLLFTIKSYITHPLTILSFIYLSDQFVLHEKIDNLYILDLKPIYEETDTTWQIEVCSQLSRHRLGSEQSNLFLLSYGKQDGMIQTGSECIGKKKKKSEENSRICRAHSYWWLSSLNWTCSLFFYSSWCCPVLLYFISLDYHRGSLSKTVFNCFGCLEPCC